MVLLFFFSIFVKVYFCEHIQVYSFCLLSDIRKKLYYICEYSEIILTFTNKCDIIILKGE